MIRTRLSRAALLSGAALLLAGPALAQTNGPGWFIPGQHSAATHAPAHSAGRPHVPATDAAALGGEAMGAEGAPPATPRQMQLPPMPKVPDVERGAMPPAAVIGVISVPDVLRVSAAYRDADKVFAERRAKLNEDAQKEQVAIRELGQQIANDRSKLSATQLATREKELQDRITASRRKFTDRGRIIQESSQYALAQIERALSEVVQKVAAARGMNLVLQRSEVALNQAEFDITAQVANLLNKTLPSVSIPPDGVEPPLAAAGTPSPAAEAAAEKAASRPDHSKAHH